MKLSDLITTLSEPAAYPHGADAVEVHQTHISVVFLAGPFAYKIKKPVDLGFLDFTTLDKRRHFCEEEVRLNRRLAPTVYRGVVPVTRTGAAVRVSGKGEVLEWAVQMTRLPESATAEARLRRGEIGVAFFKSLARTVASFHADAETGPRVASFGRFAVVAANAEENFDQSARQVSDTVSKEVFERLKTLTEAELRRLFPLIEGRAARGVPRDGHGDLRLDHVYVFPERRPPDDLAIIDCIEFNERYRCADPAADVAFLSMDLTYQGRRDLAKAFVDAYFREAGDEEGRALLPFYTAYRAAVRAKVEGMKAAESEVAQAERDAARVAARAYWLLALGELETPAHRPCLVLVGGLPGTGKSTLAHGLAERAGFSVIRSDVVRKELTAGAHSEDIYTPEWDERIYAECLRRAEQELFAGKRALVDATFRQGRMRRLFLDAATSWGVPALLLRCQSAPEAVKARLEQRRGDASDADWSVYVKAAARWEDVGPAARAALRTIDTDVGRDGTLAAALEILHREGLWA